MPEYSPEALAYYALSRAKKGAYKALAAMRAKHGDWLTGAKNELGEKELAPLAQELNDSGCHLILESDPGFPDTLREVPWPPQAIYLRGELPDFAKNPLLLAVVGTRRVTPGGQEVASWLANELAKSGVVIVSGLAFGVDAAATRGALDAGGKIISVLASGPDRITPETNRGLGERVLKSQGAIISEYPPGSEPLPFRFLERNRLISGLSRGVIIVEAPERSGSLATARFALEQGRDVFVIPGPVRHPNYRGSHKLIRAGAELVTSAEDILEYYGINPTVKDGSSDDHLSESEQKILAVLRSIGEPASVDKVAAVGKLDVRTIIESMTGLELQGLVREVAGRYIII